ncbi:MAG TPA: AbrB/MazE/SpoVT family DNA-binding domain-containing protein [Candidatus Lokiarchaeia archaeon]|nr:AbrB/MazE/SpoVT family DNA-binding domain-containing protein [Candidatus Lokiarchaeia archaeon]
MPDLDVVKITSRGMITIPLALRKKFKLTEGAEVAILEDEGRLILIPLVDIETLRDKFAPLEEVSKMLDQANAEELELER